MKPIKLSSTQMGLSGGEDFIYTAKEHRRAKNEYSGL